MLKNFIKKNLTISSLIFLSLIVVINNFYRFFLHNSSYQFDPWLSNYQGGFVRRGIPGEIFYKLYQLLDINPAIIAIGDKKPAARTQITTNRINTEASKNKLDCLNSKK